MKKDQVENKMLRGVIYESLYELQLGMTAYRKVHDKSALKKCFQQCFGSIIISAQRTGASHIELFCKGILEICDLAGWSDKDTCLDVFNLINRSLDWMLVLADPELDVYGTGEVRVCAPYKMLNAMKERLTSEMQIATRYANPAICYVV